MKLSDLKFDEAGQSQMLLGSFVANEVDPASNEAEGNYNGEHFCWFRRMRQYPITKTEIKVPTSKEDSNDGWIFLYWIVGVDGQLLSTAVRETAVNMLLESRKIHNTAETLPGSVPENETEDEYNRRTNHGTY